MEDIMGVTQFNKTAKNAMWRNAVWPESPDRTDSVFDRRAPFRKLRVMIDSELFDESTTSDMRGTPTKGLLLRSLLYNDLIELYRYTETPPASVEPIETGNPNIEPTYEGYAVLYPQKSNGLCPVTYALDDKNASYSGVMGDLYTAARDDATDKTYTGDDAADKRQADAIAVQVADDCIDADIYITTRPYLYAPSRRIAAGRAITICQPDDAISAVSLYLRAQREFIIPTGQKKFRYHLNRGMFYWVGMRELVPETWRWFSACVHHSSGTKDDKLMYLASAVMSRMQRSLELRDQIHIGINSKTNNDINDDVLGTFDNTLMTLMGAIDASARGAHYVLGMNPAKAHNAAWQRDWIKDVAKLDANLAAAVAKGSDNAHRLTVLTKLRNSIHGEAIKGITKQSGNKTETILGLPKDDEADILLSMDALGGRDAWGVKPLGANLNEVNPATLVDKLFEEVVILVNDLMRATPVEKLSHVQAANLTNMPPPPKDNHPTSDTFSEWNRLTIRWQLGF